MKQSEDNNKNTIGEWFLRLQQVDTTAMQQRASLFAGALWRDQLVLFALVAI